MIAWLFSGVFEWFHSIAMSVFEFGAQSLLSVFSYNISYFEQSVPAAAGIFNILMAVAWALLIGNCAFQCLRSMMVGIGLEADDPKETFLRTFLFAPLLIFSRQICDIPLLLVERIVALLNMPGNVPIITFDSLSLLPGFGWLFAIICSLVVIFQMVKLFLEVGERYVVLAMLTILSPLAFSMGGSKSTKDIFTGWLRMYASMCLMTVMNVITVKILFSAIATIPANDQAAIPGILLIIGICRMARRIDSIIARIGLNPAITGEPLRGGLGSAAMLVIRTTRMLANASGGSAKGSTGSGKTGSASPGASQGRPYGASTSGHSATAPGTFGASHSSSSSTTGGNSKPSRPPIGFGRNQPATANNGQGSGSASPPPQTTPPAKGYVPSPQAQNQTSQYGKSSSQTSVTGQRPGKSTPSPHPQSRPSQMAPSSQPHGRPNRAMSQTGTSTTVNQQASSSQHGASSAANSANSTQFGSTSASSTNITTPSRPSSVPTHGSAGQAPSPQLRPPHGAGALKQGTPPSVPGAAPTTRPPQAPGASDAAKPGLSQGGNVGKSSQSQSRPPHGTNGAGRTLQTGQPAQSNGSKSQAGRPQQSPGGKAPQQRNPARSQAQPHGRPQQPHAPTSPGKTTQGPAQERPQAPEKQPDNDGGAVNE